MNSLGNRPRRAPVVARFDAAAAALIAEGTDPVARTHRVHLSGRPAGGRPRFQRPRPHAAVVIERFDGRARLDLLACQVHDPDLWFADAPGDLELAKALCAGCPARAACLAGALDRREPAGVWGGQIFDQGRVVTHKRSRGRPRKQRAVSERCPA